MKKMLHYFSLTILCIYIAVTAWYSLFYALTDRSFITDLKMSRMALDETNEAQFLDKLDDHETMLFFYNDTNTIHALAKGWLYYADYIGINSPKGKEALYRAKDLEEVALSKQPASPEGWYILAYANFLLAEDYKNIEGAIKASILTGPLTGSVLFNRLHLAVMVWPFLEEDVQTLLLEQIYLAWHQDPIRTIRSLKGELGQVLIFRALEKDKFALSNYIHTVAKIERKNTSSGE